jgi:hypothetical protein
MSKNWATAIDNARKVANTVEKSARPEQHIPVLVKCIADLCDAIEDVAIKSGLSRQDATEDARNE